jgi:hypothetical protein
MSASDLELDILRLKLEQVELKLLLKQEQLNRLKESSQTPVTSVIEAPAPVTSVIEAPAPVTSVVEAPAPVTSVVEAPVIETSAASIPQKESNEKPLCWADWEDDADDEEPSQKVRMSFATIAKSNITKFEETVTVEDEFKVVETKKPSTIRYVSGCGYDNCKLQGTHHAHCKNCPDENHECDAAFSLHVKEMPQTYTPKGLTTYKPFHCPKFPEKIVGYGRLCITCKKRSVFTLNLGYNIALYCKKCTSVYKSSN